MSLASDQAGRDAESYDDDRHDGVYAPGGSRAHWFPVEPASVAISPEHEAIVAAVNAQIERAFGKAAPVKLGRAA